MMTEFPEVVAYPLSCVGLEDLRLKLEVEHKVVGPTVRGHYFLHRRDGAGVRL